MSVKRIAIVLGTGIGPVGGVRRTALFLYHVLRTSGLYEPDLVSLANSARDTSSVRLLSPPSWLRGPRVTQGRWEGVPYRHVGAWLAEFEFQRCRPRQALTRQLAGYDLVQVVSGAPGVAAVVTGIGVPKCLFVATTVRQERVSALDRLRGPRRLWLSWMTCLCSRIESQALSRMDHVFAESHYTRKLLSASVPSKRLSVAPPGVDVDLFHPPAAPRRQGCILSVGRFDDPRKNVRLLLNAYGKLRATLPGAPRLLLVGQHGPCTGDWALAREWGVADHVDVRLAVTDRELAELYRSALLFVLPSNEEGLGIVLLEAMASGLPVVSTRCGGPETAVLDGETGYLTPVGDADATAQAMQCLLADPALGQRMGQAGRVRVEGRFSRQAAGQVYLRKYRELLEA
jgi:glycosyltransferase involved in cell wall biosynthesis